MTSSHPQPRHRHGGFTLIELMVALALSLILAVALLVMQANLGKNTMRNSDVGVRDVQGRAAMDLMTQDISSAGFLFGGTRNLCATVMTYNGTGYYIHHSVDGLAAANGTALNFAASQTLDYPPTSSTVPSDVLVTTLTSSGSSLGAALVPVNPDPTNSPLTTGSLPLTSTTGMAAADVGIAQAPMNSRLACMRVTLTGITSSAVQSSSTTYSGYATQVAGAGYTGSLTNAEFYAGGAFADFGPPAAVAAPNVPPYATIAYYVSNNGGSSYPVLMRGVYNLLDDTQSYAQPVAAGVVSLQVRFGVDTTGTGLVTPPYLTAAAVTTAKQWDLVRSVRIAIVMRSLVDDPDPTYYWTPTAATPGTAATATTAGSVTPGGAFTSVPVPIGSKRRYLLQQTEVATRNLLW